MAVEMKQFGGENDPIKTDLEEDENDADALETVLHHVGDMGKYQYVLFFFMLPVSFFYVFIYLGQMFIAATPQNHWCAVPELAHLDMELRRNLSAPGATTGKWDRCSTYDVNWTQVLKTMTVPSPETPRIPCQHGWEFELTDIPYETVVSERGWVCEHAGNVPMAQTIFFAGSIVGAILCGWVADNYGRVPALMGAHLVGAIGGIATIFTKSAWDFALCRFIVGMGYDNAFIMPYILILEFVGPKHRTWVASMSIALFFGSALVMLPWIAYWISDWRTFAWATSISTLFMIFTPLIIPESVRWLVSRGRVNKAVKILRRFEKVNGTKIPDNVMDEFITKSTKAAAEVRESLYVLFKRPLLRIMMILSLVSYMSCALVFDGLVRLSDALGMDFFITFSLSSATEIPSVAILAFILDRWGRRNVTFGPIFAAGCLILIAMFVPTGIARVTLATMARFFINMSLSVVTQWSTEMIPTGPRASGMAVLHLSAYIVSMLSPYIVYSERVWSVLPLLILAIVSFIGAGASILLPETMGLAMPQTMDDGEKIVKENTLFRMAERWEGKKKHEKITEKEKALLP